MMNKKFLKGAICFAVLLSGSILFLRERKLQQEDQDIIATTSLNSKDDVSMKKDINLIVDNSSVVGEEKDYSAKNEKEILLNSDNFESRADECFRGALCEIEGDPWEQYFILKKEARNNVTDLYIAFLRKKCQIQNLKSDIKMF